MPNKILVTDTLFVYDKHVKQLETNGYEVERLEKPDATEEELCEAIKGKVGYILGGIESVTEKVINAADELKAIAIPAIGYEFFLPAWEFALDKGILVSYTPNGPTHQVAEWAITAALIMNREFLELGTVGKKQFAVTKGIESQVIGIVGMGRIGTEVARMLAPFRPKKIYYHNRKHSEEAEKTVCAEYSDLTNLLSKSDIVFVCLPDAAKDALGMQELADMKKGSLLVSTTPPGIIVEDALYDAINSGRIRAIADHRPASEKFNELPLASWYCMKSSNTITEAGSMLMSDTVTSSILNMLKTGTDSLLIPPSI